jgi:bifunctional DNA-binding transcriptional regulator/antitoxin component of YhaV-PrlF toxin-antitoxin module
LSEEDLLVVGTRSVSTKGGSLQITIPSEVAKLMDLKVGEPVLILYNRKTQQIIISKIERVETPSGLSFSISKELAKKLLKEEEKRK